MLLKFLIFSAAVFRVTHKVTCQDVPVDITQSLMTLLNEETRIRHALDLEMTDLGVEITTLQQLKANVTCGCPWHQQPVAFSATLVHDIASLGVQQQIPFDKVITNIGGGYDPRHGEFRAPVSGTYEFSASLLVTAGQWSGLEIVKDGTAIAKIRTGDSQDFTMTATVVTVEMAAGDDVWCSTYRRAIVTLCWGKHSPHSRGILFNLDMFFVTQMFYAQSNKYTERIRFSSKGLIPLNQPDVRAWCSSKVVLY